MFGFSKMFWCFFPETSAKRTHVHWCSGCFSWMNPNQFYEGCFPPNINFYLKNPFHAFLWTYYESTRSTRLRGGLWTAVWAPPRPRKSLGETCRSYKSLWLVSRSDEHLHLKQDAWVETSDNSCWFLEIIGNLMDKSETSNNANFFPGDYEELWRLSLHLSWSFDMSWTNSSHQTKKKCLGTILKNLSNLHNIRNIPKYFHTPNLINSRFLNMFHLDEVTPTKTFM